MALATPIWQMQVDPDELINSQAIYFRHRHGIGNPAFIYVCIRVLSGAVEGRHSDGGDPLPRRKLINC